MRLTTGTETKAKHAGPCMRELVVNNDNKSSVYDGAGRNLHSNLLL